MISSRVSGNVGRIAAALLTAFVTGVLYLILLGATIFANGLESLSETCPEKVLASPGSSFDAFPLQNQCNFADGTSKSLIPYWTFNGILFGAIATVLAMVLFAAAGGSRRGAEVTSRPFMDSPGLLFAAGAATAATAVIAVIGMVFLNPLHLEAGTVLTFAALMFALTVFLLSRSVRALTELRRGRSTPRQLGQPDPTAPDPKPSRTAWERS